MYFVRQHFYCKKSLPRVFLPRYSSELSVKHFITDDKINVSGLIVAGSAEFKQQLTTKDFLDPRLQNKIISVLDIAYGGNKGFEQAIELSQESLGNLKFIQEKKLLQNYMDETIYLLFKKYKIFEKLT